jgi:hypothetical protein
MGVEDAQRARRKRRQKLAKWVVSRWRARVAWRVEEARLRPAAAFAAAFLRAKALLAWSITARRRALLHRLVCFAQVCSQGACPPSKPAVSPMPIGFKVSQLRYTRCTAAWRIAAAADSAR